MAMTIDRQGEVNANVAFTIKINKLAMGAALVCASEFPCEREHDRRHATLGEISWFGCQPA